MQLRYRLLFIYKTLYIELRCWSVHSAPVEMQLRLLFSVLNVFGVFWLLRHGRDDRPMCVEVGNRHP